MISYGLDPHLISFGMVQTYVRSPHKIPYMDICIIDECHIGNFKRFIELLPDHVLVIGATATPISSSNKSPLNKVFDHVVYPIQIKELIEQGFLSAPTYHVWKIDESKLERDFRGEFTEQSQSKAFHIDDLKEAISRRIGKTIIFCSSISQSEEVFKLVDCGDKFLVHSKMKKKDRKTTVDSYKASRSGVMVNCGILTAGFDDPPITTVILYRATTSLSLYMQMCGRGSRVIPDIKDQFYIFDLGNNMKRFLPWESDRDWVALFELQGKSIKEKEAPMKKCSGCEAVIYASMMRCPYCGHEHTKKQMEAARADRVDIISSFNQLPEDLQIDFSEMSVKQLIKRAEYGSSRVGRPYKSTWVIAQLRARDNFKELIAEYAKIKGYKSGWVRRQLTTI